jgi:Flp pilus assembly CpaF family ATPase
MSLFRCVMALAAVLVAGATSASSATAQLYVMESTVANNNSGFAEL